MDRVHHRYRFWCDVLYNSRFETFPNVFSFVDWADELGEKHPCLVN